MVKLTPIVAAALLGTAASYSFFGDLKSKLKESADSLEGSEVFQNVKAETEKVKEIGQKLKEEGKAKIQDDLPKA